MQYRCIKLLVSFNIYGILVRLLYAASACDLLFRGQLIARQSRWSTSERVKFTAGDWNEPLSANGNRQRALTSFYSIRWQPPTDIQGPDLCPWCDKKNVRRYERRHLSDCAYVSMWHLHIAAYLYCHVKAVDLMYDLFVLNKYTSHNGIKRKSIEFN